MEIRDKKGRFIKGSQINLGRKRAQWELDKISKALKGKPSWNKGKALSDKHKKNLSISHKGLQPWLGKKHKPKSIIKQRLAKLGKRGILCVNWKGGVTNENRRARRYDEYFIWRDIVFKRDDWTCKKCGVRGKFMHPHHIKSFSEFETLRYVPKNGITFCRECHKKFHKIYGTKNIGNKQIEEYLIN